MNTELSVAQSESAPAGQEFQPAKGTVASRSASFWQQLTQYITLFGLAALSYLLISHYVLQSVQVVGSSMVPTLHNADHYLLNRWIYHLHSPRRGDVVVIKDPTDGSYAVKRIIAVAGDSLYLKNGTVYINGRKLEEPYLAPCTATFTPNGKNEMITCGNNQYFVMGDNRNNSLDSRTYGPVLRHNILGNLIQ